MPTRLSASRRRTCIRYERPRFQKPFRSCQFEQAQKAVDNQNAKVEELASQVNAADDEIFADFCRRIRVANIREYENVQLKAAQEENDALLKYKTQIARLEHQ
jgi:structural maintenance of chromosome 1